MWSNSIYPGFEATTAAFTAAIRSEGGSGFDAVWKFMAHDVISDDILGITIKPLMVLYNQDDAHELFYSHILGSFAFLVFHLGQHYQLQYEPYIFRDIFFAILLHFWPFYSGAFYSSGNALGHILELSD